MANKVKEGRSSPQDSKKGEDATNHKTSPRKSVPHRSAKAAASNEEVIKVDTSVEKRHDVAPSFDSAETLAIVQYALRAGQYRAFLPPDTLPLLSRATRDLSSWHAFITLSDVDSLFDEAVKSPSKARLHEVEVQNARLASRPRWSPYKQPVTVPEKRDASHFDDAPLSPLPLHKIQSIVAKVRAMLCELFVERMTQRDHHSRHFDARGTLYNHFVDVGTQTPLDEKNENGASHNIEMKSQRSGASSSSIPATPAYPPPANVNNDAALRTALQQQKEARESRASALPERLQPGSANRSRLSTVSPFTEGSTVDSQTDPLPLTSVYYSLEHDLNLQGELKASQVNVNSFTFPSQTMLNDPHQSWSIQRKCNFNCLKNFSTKGQQHWYLVCHQS